MIRALDAGDVTPEAQPAVADMIRALVGERDDLRAQIAEVEESRADIARALIREGEAGKWLSDEIVNLLKDRPEYSESLHLLLAAYRAAREGKE